MMVRAFRFLALLPVLVAASAMAAPVPEASYRALNDRLVERYLLPRYDLLQTSADRFAAASAALCRSPDAAALEAARAAFHATTDAWMAVQHVRFGPVELFMRGYRFYFWPESRGRVDDAVRQALSQDAESSEEFARASVAVQGLPAAEQLLFVGADRLDATDGGAARCRLLRAIGANLAEIAHGLRADWTEGPEPFRTVTATPGPENVYFETPRDVTLAFFKGLHHGMQIVADLRLKPVLGATIRQAQPKLAESAASERSVRNIVVSLEGLQAMYVEGGFSEVVRAQPKGPELDALMLRAFAMTVEAAKAVAGPLGKAVSDPALRPAVETLNTRVLALKQIIRTDLANTLDIAVGFNALDGD